MCGLEGVSEVCVCPALFWMAIYRGEVVEGAGFGVVHVDGICVGGGRPACHGRRRSAVDRLGRLNLRYAALLISVSCSVEGLVSCRRGTIFF